MNQAYLASIAPNWCGIYSRRAFNGYEKEILLQRGNSRCHWCGAEINRHTMEADHVRLFRFGWPTTVENGVAACQACNRSRNKSDVWNVAGLFFRKVDKTVSGPDYWGEYDRVPKDINCGKWVPDNCFEAIWIKECIA